MKEELKSLVMDLRRQVMDKRNMSSLMDIEAHSMNRLADRVDRLVDEFDEPDMLTTDKADHNRKVIHGIIAEMVSPEFADLAEQVYLEAYYDKKSEQTRRV